MKKIPLLMFILPIVMITGCNLWNSPTSDPSDTQINTQANISITMIETEQFTQIQTNTQTQSQSQQIEQKPTILTPDFTKPLKSPFTIKGKISGTFFFEGVFPIILKDGNGNILSTTLAHADTEWTTPSPVPFTAIIIFKKPNTNNGKLILAKDNPSGMPENDKQFEFDVNF